MSKKSFEERGKVIWTNTPDRTKVKEKTVDLLKEADKREIQQGFRIEELEAELERFGDTEHRNRLLATLDKSVLPQIFYKDDLENWRETIFCDVMSGGADYVNGMPRKLRLFRALVDGRQYCREYVQSSPWLPASEPPEEDEWYEVTVQRPRDGKLRVTHVFYCLGEWELSDLTSHGWEIIAWRPLPEPYTPTPEERGGRKEAGMSDKHTPEKFSRILNISSRR